ncbi:hypothetical protein A9K97_gp417 [Tokyovirus A1]|uniref:hypothetical protein n=1 Tax=Tokyovirus A1 TaxID=1826170 RepID=UPI0007A9781B|nr:hypothetical protein A9K97_gp417 [Tokyovirus A1]BAU79934.1 hypothetical protein [Tokyovirus A1]
MFLLVLVVLGFLVLLLDMKRRKLTPFEVNMVKVKSRDPLLPIKYAWWFKDQKAGRPPVFMFFRDPKGGILHSFTLDVPDADKASFLSKRNVEFLDLEVRDKRDDLLWSQRVRF